MAGRRQWVVLVLAAALTAGGGYALGASGTADRADQEALYAGVLSARYPAAFTRAFNGAWDEGFAAGQSKGAGEGESFGSARGAGDADAEVQQRVNTLADSVGGDGAEPEAPPTGTGQHVLVVGDSLEVLTSPYLPRHLPGVKLAVNAEGGYNSLQIFDLFQESYDPQQSVIVFDAGTNDNPNYPEILAGRLQAVSQIVGDRCLVVPTIHGLTVEGVGNAGKNRTVSAFAASRPGTQTPDWAGTVATHPEIMQSDDLHPTAEGADFRAGLIAEGVKACFQLNAAFPLDAGGDSDG